MMQDENGYFAKANEDLPALSLSESIYQVRMIVVPSIWVIFLLLCYWNVDAVSNTLQL